MPPPLKIFDPDAGGTSGVEEPQFLLRALADTFLERVEAENRDYAGAVRTVLSGFVGFAEADLAANGVLSYRAVRNPDGSKALWVLRRDRKWVRVTAPPQSPPDPGVA